MKTIMNPKETRHFARVLDERAADLRALNSGTSRLLLELQASHWRDERFMQFEKRYEEASVLIQQFAEHSQRYADYLRRKVVPIERYLEDKY